MHARPVHPARSRFAALLLLLALAATVPALAAAERTVVTVLPFDEAANLGDLRGAAGRAFAEAIAAELSRIPTLQLVERSLPPTKGKTVAAPGTADDAAYLTAARLRAAYAIVGTVRRIEAETEGTPDKPAPGGAAPPAGTTVVCEVGCRLLDVAARRVLLERAFTKKVQSPRVPGDPPSLPDLAKRALVEAARDAARTLRTSIPRPPLEGLVAFVDATRVFVTVGRLDGVVVGARFRIEHPTGTVRDPDTGELLSTLMEHVCTLECTSTTEHASTLSIPPGERGRPAVRDRAVIEDARGGAR